MSNWKRLPPNGGIHSFINSEFGKQEHPNQIVYPDLNDGSDLVLATDYSGEHEAPEFRVLGFLLTTRKSIETVWEPARLEVRKKYLHNDRRMAFKKLDDALRINAFPTFLKAASQLNGVLACVAVEKSFLIAKKEELQPLQYNWVPEPLEKLAEICIFGAGLVNGLRSPGQNVGWLTDEDAIVVKEEARADASALMKSCLFPYPEEKPLFGLGVASDFTEDGLRAEDLLAIPDLAAGAFSETLMTMGKENIPTSGSGPGGHTLYLKTKSTLINGFFGERGNPLKVLSCLVRRHPQGMMLSFGQPFARLPMPGESTEGAVPTNEKWRKSLAAELARIGADPKEILKDMGVDT
ncbi:MAG: hypothetical protein K8U57_27715 [Planctomycetes bacterium]|nr:hypothetical protein [Planctomycetota bacterium]